jgi:hypothetical protein
MPGKFAKTKGHALVRVEEGGFRTVDPGSVIECADEAEAEEYVRRGLGEPSSGPATFKTPSLESGASHTQDHAERADAARMGKK